MLQLRTAYWGLNRLLWAKRPQEHPRIPTRTAGRVDRSAPLTNARQLFAGGHIQDATGAQHAFHNHDRRSFVNAADPRRAVSEFVRLHDLQRPLPVLLGHERDESSFARDMQRIES